jgi:hypothetical protein
VFWSAYKIVGTTGRDELLGVCEFTVDIELLGYHDVRMYMKPLNLSSLSQLYNIMSESKEVRALNSAFSGRNTFRSGICAVPEHQLQS